MKLFSSHSTPTVATRAQVREALYPTGHLKKNVLVSAEVDHTVNRRLDGSTGPLPCLREHEMHCRRVGDGQGLMVVRQALHRDIFTTHQGLDTEFAQKYLVKRKARRMHPAMKKVVAAPVPEPTAHEHDPVMAVTADPDGSDGVSSVESTSSMSSRSDDYSPPASRASLGVSSRLIDPSKRMSYRGPDMMSSSSGLHRRAKSEGRTLGLGIFDDSADGDLFGRPDRATSPTRDFDFADAARSPPKPSRVHTQSRSSATVREYRGRMMRDRPNLAPMYSDKSASSVSSSVQTSPDGDLRPTLNAGIPPKVPAHRVLSLSPTKVSVQTVAVLDTGLDWGSASGGSPTRPRSHSYTRKCSFRAAPRERTRSQSGQFESEPDQHGEDVDSSFMLPGYKKDTKLQVVNRDDSGSSPELSDWSPEASPDISRHVHISTDLSDSDLPERYRRYVVDARAGKVTANTMRPENVVKETGLSQTYRPRSRNVHSMYTVQMSSTGFGLAAFAPTEDLWA